jgi:excisionase family DNA binding protein
MSTPTAENPTTAAPPSNAVDSIAIALSRETTARALEVSTRHVSRLIASGKLIARKEGRRTLIDAESVRKYYASLPLVRS